MTRPCPSAAKALPRSLAVALALGGAPALAQEWGSTCGPDLCTVSRAVSDAATGSRVATLLAVVTRGEERVTVGAVVPLGTAAEPGLRLVHAAPGAAEVEVAVPIQVCFPDGCRGLLPVEPAAFAAMAEAGEVEVRFFPWSAERPVAVPVPTDGLSAAVEAARAELSGP